MKRAIVLNSMVLFIVALAGCGKTTPPTPTILTLHQAALFYPDQIPALLKTGIKVDRLDADGATALWQAVRSSKRKSVRLLLAAGADPEIRDRQQSWTPLQCSAFCNHGSDGIEIAKLLLQHGANPNAVEPKYNETALHYAVISTQSPLLVQLLLDAGADIDALSSNGSTPLQSTVSQGNTEIADLLLASGADPELRNKFGFRPIDQLNSCSNPTDIQVVFRKYDADDIRRPQLIKANVVEETGKDFL
ncbi:MAG: hypothetical protein GXP24_09765 [Planctomycetes bacterium]|nr:hypothetical protein [Planctomycetota bacterium]